MSKLCDHMEQMRHMEFVYFVFVGEAMGNLIVHFLTNIYLNKSPYKASKTLVGQVVIIKPQAQIIKKRLGLTSTFMCSIWKM